MYFVVRSTRFNHSARSRAGTLIRMRSKNWLDRFESTVCSNPLSFGVCQLRINFEIIAGERRWRAAQKAGLREVLVVVRDVSSKDAFELALIENVQREDLDAIEFAEALQRLVDEHGYTQDSLAQRVGKDRSTIANALRLLKLPVDIRERVVNGELSEGHARALLGAPDQRMLILLADKVVRGHLNVRQTEELVRASKRDKPTDGKGAASAKSASVRDLESRLC